MINRHGATPIYIQAADLLRDRITDGEWLPGEYLPSEPDLAHHYGLGRDTIRDALALLANEGVIVTSRGRRAMVRESGDRETVVVEPGSTVISRMPSRREREKDGIGPGVPVFVVIDASGAGQSYPADRVQLSIPEVARDLPD